MKTYKQKTFSQKKEAVERNWHLVDAQEKVLGRVAVEIATLLIGKNKPTYTPHIEGGDYVVVTNASLVQVTNGKETKKMYYRHSGFPGGLKEFTFAQMMERKPDEALRLAVKNMLPKNRLRDVRMARLKIFADDKHTYENYIKNA
ncbi:MAG: 50S ribosomal protein L13 [Pseudomonadales bacterium]|jgi:large subunit ribosomal protein L13|nr:50S ribosomal protein L13 [Pseudomonadales bacterium]